MGRNLGKICQEDNESYHFNLFVEKEWEDVIVT